MINEPVTINVCLDNLREGEREKLLALIEKANKPVPKTWIPIESEAWYQITGDGCTREYNWRNNDFCWQCYAIGNYFKTREEAKFAVEKLKVIAELKRFAEEHNEFMDWGDIDDIKWCIMYNHTDKTFYICSQSYIQIETINFSSKEIAQKAIEYIGEDRLKRYYFEVQEEQNDSQSWRI